jgi:DNA-directed RNA polymerase specialized sigma24 family protein
VTGELLARLRAGDAEARRELFRHCQTTFRPYFQGRLPNPDDVDDCVSEVVTRALEGIRGGLEPKDLGAWLGGIARNVLKERYEAKERAKGHVDVPADVPRTPVEPPLDLDQSGDLPEVPSELEFLMGKRQLWAAVDDAIKGLPDGFARIMRAHVRLSREKRKLVVGTELAAALEMPVTGVNRQLGRARRAMKDAIVALVLARTGRSSCPELAAIVGAGVRVVLDSVRSRAVGQHAAGCVVCGERVNQADAYSKWALGPGLIGLRDDEEERRRALVALLSRGGDASATRSPAAFGVVPAPLTAPLAAAPKLGLADRVRGGIAARIARMPDGVMQFAVHNPDVFRRVVAAVVAGVVLVGAAFIAGAGDPPDTDAAPHPPDPTRIEAPGTAPTAPVSSTAAPSATSAGVRSTSSQASVERGAEPAEPAADPLPVSTTTAAPGRPTHPVNPTTTAPTTTPTTTRTADLPPPQLAARWGYVRVNAQYNQYGAERGLNPDEIWGTWRVDPDPAIRGRNATLVHDAPGQYRLRLPDLGSPDGIVHVSVNNWTAFVDQNMRSCGVRDSQQDGLDQVVTVACHNLTGVPSDVRFDLLLTVPTQGGAPMVAVRYPGGPVSGAWTMDSGGGHPQVTRTETGRYLVSVLGEKFTDSGYLQVTPYGDVPARCRNEDVLSTGVGVLLVVGCHADAPGAPPVDTGWQLTYVQGAPLTHDPTVPGAYAQVTGVAPGLTVETDHSYNSANGYMTVQRMATGWYRVGFRGVGRRGDALLVSTIGPEPGHCHGYQLISYQQPGDTWAWVACTDAAGKPADRRFGVAVIRPPGDLVGARGPVVPGPPPAGPRWGYARMLAHDIPLGIETQLDPQWQWTTWSRGVPLLDALWVRKATVIHQATGRYRVRLPGIGSRTGLAHVTPYATQYPDSCSIVDNQPDGIDELVDVACLGPTGAPKDLWFNVFFGTAGRVMFRAGPAGEVTAVAGRAEVSRVGPGRYEAVVSEPGLTGRGYPQLTTVGTAPVRCHVAGVTGAVRIRVDCDTIAGVPADSGWQLTYVEAAGLQSDSSVPTAYTTVAGGTVDAARSYASDGEMPTVTRRGTGRYTISYTGLGDRVVYPGDSVQVTVFGAGHCVTSGWNSLFAPPAVAVYVDCYSAGRLADTDFGVAYLRRPPE